MIAPAARRIYDPATQARVARRHARRIAIVIAVCGVVSGGLIGGLHVEELPFLAVWLGHCDGVRLWDCEYPRSLDWLAGVAGAVAFAVLLAPLVPLARRRVTPSVSCRSCDGTGWIRDLVATSGRCPRCGGNRFDFREVEASPVFYGGALFLPLVRTEHDVAGSDLLARGPDE